MPAILNVLLALLGIGAVASGAGGGDDATSPASEPVSDPEPRFLEEEEPPSSEGLQAPIEIISAPEEESFEESGDPAVDAPELPNTAYALEWEGLTASEQYMLELVNRARMDPEAEEDRTGELVDSGVSTAPKQALAVDPILSAAADNHSRDMLERNFFDHTNPDKEGPTDRAREEDWEGGGVWENISARWTSANSISNEQAWVEASHWGLWESDGHQYGMLQESHTVVGIGIDVDDWVYAGDAFPTAMLVTEKFANDGQTYLTGVVFDDSDNDDFYDMGEGQGGVKITVWSDEMTYATSTWDAGGYSVAVAPGSYNVLFEGGDLNSTFETVVTVGSQNVKLDVNEDDLGASMLAMTSAPSGEDADPIEALFLSAEASQEVIEREMNLADALIDEEDLLEMV